MLRERESAESAHLSSFHQLFSLLNRLQLTLNYCINVVRDFAVTMKQL